MCFLNFVGVFVTSDTMNFLGAVIFDYFTEQDNFFKLQYIIEKEKSLGKNQNELNAWDGTPKGDAASELKVKKLNNFLNFKSVVRELCTIGFLSD